MRKLFLLALITITLSCTNSEWKLVDSGIYDHVEYIGGHSGNFNMPQDPGKTVIYFQDGHTYILPYQRNIIVHCGDSINIMMQYNYSNYRIVKVKR